MRITKQSLNIFGPHVFMVSEQLSFLLVFYHCTAVALPVAVATTAAWIHRYLRFHWYYSDSSV
jgi:hypothetical protein